jgi:hypothetical protein
MEFKSKPRGGKRIGAGRKSNAVRLLETGFVADWFTPQFQKIKWNQLVNSKDELVALRAMAYLTDRLYGKPKQQHEVSADVQVKTVIVQLEPKREIVRPPLRPEFEP